MTGSMAVSPATLLPHRYPFLFLDGIIIIEQRVSATATAAVTSTHGFPQILLAECVAQLAGVLTIDQEGEGGFLAAIDHAEFGRPPVCGDLLAIRADVVKGFGRLFMIAGSVSCGDETLATVSMTLGVGRLS